MDPPGGFWAVKLVHCPAICTRSAYFEYLPRSRKLSDL